MKYQNKGQKIMFKFCGKYVSNYKKQLTLYLLISIISTIITLDRESKVEFFNLLKEIKKEKIIIFISHDRELNNVADHIIDMSLMNSK